MTEVSVMYSTFRNSAVLSGWEKCGCNWYWSTDTLYFFPGSPAAFKPF